MIGSENFYWNGTPLLDMYLKQNNLGKNSKTPIKDAGKDAEWILKKVLKKVLKKDDRKYETKKEDLIRKYRWIE